MRSPIIVAAVLSFAVLAHSASAQGSRLIYQPSYDNPTGRELVAVLVSYSHCIGNTYPGFLASVDSMNHALAAQAKRRGVLFVSVGVATDWDPDSGFAYLKSLSRFNEIIVGRNWFNLGVAHYVWADSLGKPNVPQVVLLERTITLGKTSVQVGTDRVLARYPDARQIVEWVKQGAPLP